MTLIFFWIVLGVIVYTLIGFPALLLARAYFRPRPYHCDDITPAISVLIAAHNEATCIEARIENLLTQDYPRECIEVIVASDGSDDGTNEIVERYTDQGVRLLALPRQGKIAALNQAEQVATGDILVFSDANTSFARNALRALVAPFADPQIGGVAGNQIYQKGATTGAAADGERAYWNFDRLLKWAQSAGGNVTSATGAIYAIRRSLYRPIPPGVTDDFVASAAVIAQGYRLVFAADAVAREPVASAGSKEFRRKVRVITQGLRAVWVMRELLNPVRYGFYAWQLFSHKVLRRLIVVPLLLLAILSPLVWNAGLFYQALTMVQAVVYGCGLLGLIFSYTRLSRVRALAIPFYFCMVNFAALCALFKTMGGGRIEHWQPQRLDPIAPGTPQAH